MLTIDDMEEVYVGLARIYDDAIGTSRATELFYFAQEPDFEFSAPFEWLVDEGIRVEDLALYERAVDVARQLIAETTAEGDDYIPWWVEQHLQPFIEMHERTPAAT
ncbi:hypothetical protein [Brevibacterium otitidis]|uniref:CdiI immunity protein domain-containing protein n=1 Tax=Brevibacterium otitidis TaxID=53364 RepID=A0ABV5X0M8_9MICO|nr:hypothetical protein GCM10023233_14250 [Brevibacterium otitidis]